MLKGMRLILTGAVGALILCGVSACSPAAPAATPVTTVAPTDAPGDTPAPADDASATPAPTPVPTPNDGLTALQRQLAMPAKGDQIAVMTTSMGTITFKFFPQYAPKAVENFLTLAQQGYYDGVTFHRVIKDFMIQGGDPTGTGTGGESIWGTGFGLETTLDLRHINGALAMANTGQPDSNGSQFYIVDNHTVSAIENSYGMSPGELAQDVASIKADPDGWADEAQTITNKVAFPDDLLDYWLNEGGFPVLDGGYTIFGQVIAGMDVVDAIDSVPTIDPTANPSNDKPIDDVVIQSIEVTTY